MRNLIYLILVFTGCANPLKPERVYDITDYKTFENNQIVTGVATGKITVNDVSTDITRDIYIRCNYIHPTYGAQSINTTIVLDVDKTVWDRAPGEMTRPGSNNIPSCTVRDNSIIIELQHNNHTVWLSGYF